jgi:hypothetical protein
MNALASFTLDRDFFDDYYRDWLRHVQPWKALLLPAAIVQRLRNTEGAAPNGGPAAPLALR